MCIFRLLFVICGLTLALSAGAQQQVTLQLKWTHAFQFAGYYAAKAQGFYRDAGLEVQILPAQAQSNPVTEVLSGRAQFGVGTSSLLLERQAGKPVVVLAAVMQHSPQVLITGPDDYLRSLHDLAGRPIMLEPQSEELVLMLRRLKVAYQPSQITSHSQSISDLINGRVAAMSAYSTYEPYGLHEAGVRHRMYRPRAVGIDFYGDNLFTSEALLRQQPKMVEAFRAASMRGWLYALEHPQEVIELILRDYAPTLSRDFLDYEAQNISELVHAELIELGYMKPERWRHIADTYAELGLLPAGFDVQGFVYQHPDALELLRAQRYLWLALAFIVLGGLLAAYVFRINLHLRSARNVIAASRTHYRMLAEQIKDVIWVFDVTAGRYTYVSPPVQLQRGYSPEEVMSLPPEQTCTPESWQRLKQSMEEALARFQASDEQVSDFSAVEVELLRKDGSTVWTEGITRLVREARTGHFLVYGVSRDITERRQQEAQTRHQAQHDGLTGLPNRSWLTERLGRALAAADGHGHELGLIFLDLDHFKPVNDIHGHAVGDKLLQAAAQRMRHSLRDSDTVARFGGDEFVVLLPQVRHAGDALQIADKLRLALEQPFFIDGQTLCISASLGLAMYPCAGADAGALMHHADQALYCSKQQGRNRVTRYLPPSQPMPLQ